MLQGKFQDGSELIIGIDSCMYINEAKTKSVFPSKTFSEQDPTIINKKKAIEEVIHRISKLRKQVGENKENNNWFDYFRVQDFFRSFDTINKIILYC